MSQMSFDEVKSKAEALVARAQSDADFMKQLQANPEQVILEAGLPKEAVSDLAFELNLVEVAGYNKCWFTCLSTCSVTYN